MSPGDFQVKLLRGLSRFGLFQTRLFRRLVRPAQHAAEHVAWLGKSFMSTNIDFSGPFLKTERAEQHIQELERIFSGIRGASEDALLSPDNVNGTEGLRYIGGVFARHTPTVLGDALHNLRASLDHAYCLLVKANGGEVRDRVNFPIHAKGDRRSFEGSIDGHIKAGCGPSQSVRDYIVDTIQPYAGGRGKTLIGLHLLDIADKHMILLPVESATDVTNLEYGEGCRISGIQFITDGPPAFAIKGPINQDKSKVSFSVLFGRGQPFELQSVMPALKDMLTHVNETLRELACRA